MAGPKLTGGEIRQALGPLEAYGSFHSLLQALCITRKILSYQALAYEVELDESLVKSWWTGSSRPGKGRAKDRTRRNDEILATFLGVDLDRHVLARWDHLLVEGRRRSKPSDTLAPPIASEPRKASSTADDSVNASGTDTDAAPADVLDKHEASIPVAKGLAVGSCLEAETDLASEPAPSEPIAHDAAQGVPTKLGNVSPVEGKPSETSAEVLADGSLASAAPTRRHHFTVASWSAIGVGTAIVIMVGWMTFGSPSSNPGRQCDLLAAAPWDPTRPSGVKGVSFEEIRPAEGRKACRQASEQARGTPNEARYRFQLGRVHDRMGEYDAAFSDYQISTDADPRYAAPHLNMGLLHDSGQLSAGSRVIQQHFRNPAKAALRYEQAAKLGLPWGRFCYALALLFGDGGRLDKTEAVRQLKLAQDAMRSADASSVKAEVDELLEEITTSRPTTKHTVCERQNGIEPPERVLPNGPD